MHTDFKSSSSSVFIRVYHREFAVQQFFVCGSNPQPVRLKLGLRQRGKQGIFLVSGVERKRSNFYVAHERKGYDKPGLTSRAVDGMRHWLRSSSRASRQLMIVGTLAAIAPQTRGFSPDLLI